MLNVAAIRDWQLRGIVTSTDNVQHVSARRRTERKMRNRPYACRLWLSPSVNKSLSSVRTTHVTLCYLDIYTRRMLTKYLLTYSMVQSPSWEANWFAASQVIPRISRNPKVLYRTHKRPPPVSILGQPNPVHIPTSDLLDIHPNIIHPSTPRSPQWSLSLRFPHQEPRPPPLLTHSRDAGCWPNI